MKRKITAVIVCAALAYTANAQTMNDALLMSRENFYGTARSMALGNAATAVGGDLGMVGINPAGSAVAGYSQVQVSPGLTISSSSTSFAPAWAENKSVSSDYPGIPTSLNYQAQNKATDTRFSLPNIGVIINLKTHLRQGIKSVSFGLVANVTDIYNNKWIGGGNTQATSFSGALATYSQVNADGAGHQMNPMILSEPGGDAKYQTGNRWQYIVAYHGGVTNYDDAEGMYFGSAESKVTSGFGGKSYAMIGTLKHTMQVQETGDKRDLLINFGMNINDRWYVGFNLGVPSVTKKYTELQDESIASDKEDFKVTPEYWDSKGEHVVASPTHFSSDRYIYEQMTYATGIYGKFGFIGLLGDNFRVGVSAKTPALFYMTEEYRMTMYGNFEDTSSNGTAYTPLGRDRYNLQTPYSFGFGAAYTFSEFALLSVDYELTDFSVMRYKFSGDDAFYRSGAVFDRLNNLNRLFCGVGHAVRAGFEIRPIPALSARIGFNFTSDPTKYYLTDKGAVDAYAYDANYEKYQTGELSLGNNYAYNTNYTYAYSFGLGYQTRGSFFADLAAKVTTYPTTYVSPYGDYIDTTEYYIHSPGYKVRTDLWAVVLTLGWRF